VTNDTDKPILFVDVDGVISLFGFAPDAAHLPGPFHWIDGIAHCIPQAAGERLKRLEERFELVWATGWEEKANEYLPFILGLDEHYPVLTFDGRAVFGSAHWKLDAIDEYAGDRPAAWIDDNLDDACKLWTLERSAPTLLVETRPATGITDEHVDLLLEWADEISPGTASETTHVQAFLRAVEALNAGDAALLKELVTDDLVFKPLRASAEGAYEGHDGVERFLADNREAFEEFRANYDEVIDLGEDRLLAAGTVYVRGRGSGADSEVATAGIATIRDGKLAGWEDYGDRDRARQAAGPDAL
jgi:ketosteroid isomerase-like protein